MRLFCILLVFIVFFSSSYGQTIDWTLCPANARAVFQNRTFVTPLTSGYMTNIRNVFPETKTPNPLIVNQNTDVFLQITSDNATVDLTYVLSITGNRNSFGYFIFDPVTRAIAPNPGLVMLYPLLKDVVPSHLPAGCMNPGYTITLGPFRSGTIIGFYILVNAWSDGNTPLNLGARAWYSMTSPSIVNVDGNKHTSWANIDGNIVIGFEDGSMGDRDYNDVMFQWRVNGTFNETAIVKYENGFIQGCITANIIKFADVGCYRYAILENSNAQGCASFIRIPAGYIIAPNNAATMAAIAASANLRSTGTQLILAGNVCVRADGSSCTSVPITTFSADSQCIGVPCAQRIVIRTQFALSGCTGLENSFCDSNIGSVVINRDPTTAAVNKSIDPLTWVSYVVPTNPIPRVTLPVSLTTFANAIRPIDILLVVDFNGMSAADWDTFNTNLNTFITTATAAFPRTMQLGYAILRASTVDVASLNSDVTGTASRLAAVTLGTPFTSATRDIYANVASLITRSGMGWRSLSNNPGLAVVLVITKSTPLSSGLTTLGSSAASRNVVPLFIADSAVLSSYQSLSLPFYNSFTHVFPRFASSAQTGLTWAASNSAVTPVNDLSSRFAFNLAAFTPTVGTQSIDLVLSWPSPAPVGFVSPSVLSYVIWGYNIVTVRMHANQAPTLTGTGIAADEDTATTFSLTSCFADTQTNRLQFRFTSLPAAGVSTIRTAAGGAVALNTWYPATDSFSMTGASNYNGAFNVGVLVSDGCENSTGLIPFTIRAINDPPTAQPISVTMLEDEPDVAKRTIDFGPALADIDSPTPTVYIATLPDNGQLFTGASFTTAVTLNTPIATNTVRFNPAINFNGVTSFTYYAVDSSTASSSVATVTITVTPVNDPPFSNNVTLTTNEDVPLTIDVITGSDLEGDALTLVITQTVTSGTLTPGNGDPLGSLPANVASGVLLYTPPANQNSSPFSTFKFRFFDGTDSSPVYTATINVLPVNDAPTGTDFTVNTNEDTALTISFVSRISDIDTAAANLVVFLKSTDSTDLGTLRQTSASGIDLTAGAQLTQQSIYFIPQPDQVGTYTFTYDVFDGQARSDIYTVTVNVIPVNDAPTLSAPTTVVITDRLVPTTFPLYIRDVDLGDTLRVRANGLTVTASEGSLAVISPSVPILTSTNTLLQTYADNDASRQQLDIAWNPSATAPNSLNGTVTFQVTDAAGAVSNSVTVYLRVSANKLPTVNTPADIITDEDVTFTGYRIEASDTDAGQGTTLTAYIASLPEFGTIVQNGVDYTTVGVALGTRQTTVSTTFYLLNYRPNPNYNGPDAFSFYFVDSLGASSAIQEVSITVNPVNDQPTTNGFTITMNEDTTATITQFSFNEIDSDDTITLRITAVPALGTLQGPVGNDNTVAVNNEFTFSNAESWQLRYTPAANGNGSPYTTFKFRVRDSSGAGNALSVEQTVTINVLSINDPPVAADIVLNTDEDVFAPFLFADYVSDSDHADDQLVVVITSLPSNGVIRITTDGSTYTTVTSGQVIAVNAFNARYVPNANYYGSDTFQWFVRDPAGATSTGLGYINVDPVNDAPTSQDKTATTIRDVPVDISNFVTVDVDNDASNIELIIVSLPIVGTLSFDGDALLAENLPTSVGNEPTTRVLTWTPPDFSGILVDPNVPVAQFTFKLNDGAADSPVYTVLIYLAYTNTMPLSEPSVTYVDEDTVATITIVATDLESPYTDLSVVIVSIDPNNIGTFYLDSALTQPVQVNDLLPTNGKTFYYQSPPDVNSAEGLPLATFTFQIRDGEDGYSSVYNGLVYVTPVNDPAIYNGASTLAAREDEVLVINLGSQLSDIDSPGDIDITITSTVAKGQLFVCADNSNPCQQVNVVNGDKFSGAQRQLKFLAAANEFGDNYATFSFRAIDSDNLQSSTYQITINVLPINDPPVLVPHFPVLPERVVMFEDTQQVLEWDATDVDSDVTTLVARLTSLVPVNAKLYSCDTTDGAYCNQGDELTPPIDLNSQFNNGTWRVLFVPNENAYDDRNFAAFSVVVTDAEGSNSNSVRTIIRVRPVNDAPTITAETTDVVSNADTSGASRTPLSLFVIADVDAGNKIIELTITSEPVAGAFEFGSTLNNVPCVIEADSITCKASQSDLRDIYMANLYFASNITTQTTLNITVNDLGNTDWNDEPLAATVIARILYNVDTGLLTESTEDNTLTIAVSVSAAAVAGAVAIVIWRVKKRNAAVDNYFEDLTDNLNSTQNSVIYAGRFADGANPFYQEAKTN